MFESDNQKNAPLVERAAVKDVSAGAPAHTIARAVINVWMVDNQPMAQEVVAAALQQTDDVFLGGYFVHPEDALLCNGGAKHPDVILLDVDQFGPTGAQALRAFGTAFPSASRIVLTDSFAEEVIWAAVCAGASGYLLKAAPAETLAQSIREVVAGGACLAPVVANSVLEMVRRLSGTRPDHSLTERELKILELMGQDLLMKEIAEQLALSYHTVDTHLRNIYGKLGVRSRTAAVAKALRERII